MTVAQALSELLYERDAVTITGLGTFSCDYESAKVNVITHRFERPSARVAFDPQRREENDVLVRYLMVSDGLAEDEARQQVAQFVADCFTELKEGREVALAGIGTLCPDAEQAVVFVPAASNFNGDAFGLSDFSPKPVFGGPQQTDWRAQVARQLKDQNTPMTVDAKAVHEDLGDEQSFERSRRRRVLWTVLSVLLLIPAILLILYFLEVIHFDLPSRPKPQPPVVAAHRVPVPDSAMQALLVRYDWVPPVETVAEGMAGVDSVAEGSVADTAVAATPDTLAPVTAQPKQPETPPNTTSATAHPETPEPFQTTASTTSQPEHPETASSSSAVTPQPKPQPSNESDPEILPYASMLPYAIIGGCFSQQANAEHYLVPIREQGYPEAFLMQKNGMYYVCYGQYATIEEAKKALSGIWANANPKAWILTK